MIEALTGDESTSADVKVAKEKEIATNVQNRHQTTDKSSPKITISEAIHALKQVTTQP